MSGVSYCDQNKKYSFFLRGSTVRSNTVETQIVVKYISESNYWRRIVVLFDWFEKQHVFAFYVQSARKSG